MKKSYTEQEIVDGFRKFHTAHGRFPAQSDLRNSEDLPDSKTLERRYGGIVAFRKKHGMGDDLRKGEVRSAEIAQNIANRSSAYWNLHSRLVSQFGQIAVHQEGRTIKVFKPDGSKVVLGYFYPSQASNFDPCLRYARKKPADLYVCLNESIQPPVWPEKVVSITNVTI